MSTDPIWPPGSRSECQETGAAWRAGMLPTWVRQGPGPALERVEVTRTEHPARGGKQREQQVLVQQAVGLRLDDWRIRGPNEMSGIVKHLGSLTYPR